MTKPSAEFPSFPLGRQCPFQPPAEYSEAQQRPGLSKVQMWDGHTAWLVTRYDDVRAVIGDNRFSTNPSTPGYPSLSPARDSLLDLEPSFIRMDPPEHGRYRRMLTKEFMVKRISDIRPTIQKISDTLIDDMLLREPPADLVQEYCLPLTSRVIAEMLGVPFEDHDFFQEQSRLKTLLNADPEVPKLATERIQDYLDQLITQKTKQPQDDLLSRLVIEQVNTGHLSHRELVVMADLLLMAGHETTANQIALGVYTLLQRPDQLELLRADPSLVRGAVEEMLRFYSIVHYNAFRVALEDVEVASQLVRKGEAVIALVAAANRDPSAFPRPDEFDITRKSDHHVAFSYGVHQCLGQPLARAELQVVFGSIFQRISSLQLAVPEDQLEWKTDHIVFGLEALPVTWR